MFGCHFFCLHVNSFELTVKHELNNSGWPERMGFFIMLPFSSVLWASWISLSLELSHGEG